MNEVVSPSSLLSAEKAWLAPSEVVVAAPTVTG